MLIVAQSPLDHPGVALRTRLTGFTGFLRANGFGVGGDDSIPVLEAARQAGVLDAEVLRWSLKAVLCGRGDEWRRFDPLFDAYFLPPNRRVYAATHAAAFGLPDAANPPDGTDTSSRVAAKGHGNVDDGDQGSERHGASRQELLASTDFRDLDRADQRHEIDALMRRFARRLKHLQLRRQKPFDRGRRLDLRRTIRRSVGSGGTPVRLAWTDRRRIRPRLVLLLDVSRSMSQYSFFYLRLARALRAELADVCCFIFHTRITDIGGALSDPDPWRAQERLHLLAAGWGGGTRIGECLDDFNHRAGSRLVHSRAGVVIVSDGYDTGEPELLAAALGALRRRARRIVWINPLLSQPTFRPESRGMRAALPHLDLLAPGADLASVERTLQDVIEVLR